MSDSPYDLLKELEGFDRGKPTPIQQTEESSSDGLRSSTNSLNRGSSQYKPYTENVHDYRPTKEDSK